MVFIKCAFYLVLNLGFFLKHVILKVTVILFLNYFSANYFISTWRPDLLFRSNLNDFLFMNFHFFWTNVWYLLKFLCVLLLVSCCLTSYFTSILFSLVLHNILLCLIVTLGVVSTNCTFVHQFGLDNSKINTLLLNKINRIHPPLFYLGFFVYLTSPILCVDHKFQCNYQQYKFTSHCAYAFVLLGVSLYLGGWWALQEGSWGGWWNWDSSEVFGVYLLYTITRVYHMQLGATHTSRIRLFSALSLYLLLLYYFLMQFNFTLTAHNFGFRKKHFLFEKLLLVGVLAHFFTATTYLCANQTFLVKASATVKPRSNFYTLYLIVIVLSLFIIALVPLVNYNLYIDTVVSTTLSSLLFISVIFFFLALAYQPSSFFAYAVVCHSYNLQIAVTAPLRETLSNTWFTHHVVFLVTSSALLLYVNKSHSWFSCLSYSVDVKAESLLRHSALFFSESAYIEVFKKLEPSKIFRLGLGDKTAHQILLSPSKLQTSELFTSDYSVFFLSYIPGYLCLAYAFSVCATSVL